jgi:hypothetical protein
VRVGEVVDLRVEVRHRDAPLRFVAVNWGDGTDDTNEAAQALDVIECEVGAGVPPPANDVARRTHAYKAPGVYEVTARAFTSGCFADRDSATGADIVRVLPRR